MSISARVPGIEDRDVDFEVFRFKAIAGLVKETKESTRDALQTLCKM